MKYVYSREKPCKILHQIKHSKSETIALPWGNKSLKDQLLRYLGEINLYKDYFWCIISLWFDNFKQFKIQKQSPGVIL